MFFCYERDFSNRWTPAVFAEKPEKKKSAPDRSPFRGVPPELVDADGNPDLKKLVAMFPPPLEIS